MLFRLTNVLVTCQVLVNNIIQAHLDRTIIAYLNNILIYSKTKEVHIQHVQDILTCLLQARLLLKLEKYEFHKELVEFLGFIVSTTGIHISPEKIKAIAEQPILHDVKSVQSFLGFMNFNRRFIKGYLKIALPLIDITKKEKGF